MFGIAVASPGNVEVPSREFDLAAAQANVLEGRIAQSRELSFGLAPPASSQCIAQNAGGDADQDGRQPSGRHRYARAGACSGNRGRTWSGDHIALRHVVWSAMLGRVLEKMSEPRGNNR